MEQTVGRKEVGKGIVTQRYRFPALPPLESELSRSAVGLRGLWFQDSVAHTFRNNS